MSGAADDVVYARFGRRAWASIVDAVFFAATSSGLLYLFYGADYFAWMKEQRGTFEFYGSGDAIVQYLFPLVVTVAMWRAYAATPGKLLAGCQVVDATTLKRVSIRQAVIRYFGYFVSLLPLGAGFLWVLIDKRRQGFHDKLAGTVVIIEEEARNPLPQLERDAS